jgi:hypothetical protein
VTAETTYRNAELGFELSVPEGGTVDDGVPGVACVVLEPAGLHPRFRANVTVTVEPVSLAAAGTAAFTDGSLATQAAILQRFVVLDREPAALGLGLGERTLGHHDVEGLPVVVDQWRIVDGDRGWGVTGSCWAPDYDDVADSFAAIAASLRRAGPR